MDSQVKVGFVDTANQVWVGCAAPATAAQCPAINALLPRFFGQIPRTAKNDLYFGRLDYHLNDKNTFSASFNFCAGCRRTAFRPVFPPPPAPESPATATIRVTVRNGKATWTSVISNGRSVNSFRYGLDTDRQADGFDQAELGGGLGYLDVSVAGVQLGPATYLPRVEPMEIAQRIRRRRELVQGQAHDQVRVHLRACHDNVNYLSNRYGSYTYPTVTSFALDYTGNTTGAKNWSAYQPDVRQSAGATTRSKTSDSICRISGRLTDRLTADPRRAV